MVISTESQLLTRTTELRAQVELIANSTPVADVHTHLFPHEFKDFCLYGIDELLTYHYLTAEMFRSARISYDEFWRLPKADQADIVWKTLFVENTPASEAARGIISVLDVLGLDTRAENLKEARAFFASQDLRGHIDQVFDIAGVSSVVMTNDPLDEGEGNVWNNGVELDHRFKSSLRLDRLLNHWDRAPATIAEQRSFLDRWIERMRPVYMGVSLPADFKFPAGDTRERLLREVVLPTAKEHRLALTLMIGVRRRVNPSLREAGDGVGKADVTAVERMCAEYPDVKFLATFLSRENQHELCVAARKFKNLMPFGCWWFLNNPSIVSEITRERLELLGTSFIPQHSDARVLDQLIYKWEHSRQIIAKVLADKFEDQAKAGRPPTDGEIEKTVKLFFGENFERFRKGE